MKMSANENESVDIRLYSNRRSNLIDLEELNRMERPSRVFSSHHHLSMPPVLTDTNNMEQDQPIRVSRDYYNFFENLSHSIGGSTAIIGDNAARNRSPFVRFTITDPETQQITATGQIPLNNTPPSTQTSSLTTNNEVADVSMNDESDDEPLNLNFWIDHNEQRQLNTMTHNTQQSRNSRSGRRSRRFTEHPYFIRNNLDNNPSNSRAMYYNRRVRFSTNRGYNDHPPDRLQTPEQELPEVLGQVMEPENQYEDVSDNYVHEVTSVSSDTDADSGDETGSTQFSVSENHNTNVDEENRVGTLDVPNETPRSNETPRARVVPFIMSPTPFSSRTDSPPDTPELQIPVTSLNNNLVDAPVTIPSLMNNDDNQNNVFRNTNGSVIPLLTENTIPGPSQFILNNGSVRRSIDVELNNTESEAINNNSVRIDEIAVNDNNSEIETILRPLHPTSTSVLHRNNHCRGTEETVPVRVEEHPETYEGLNDQLIRLFECPVCFEHIVPPIFQCLLGHLICNKCVLMCENCPTCRNPFNSKRNLYMEKVCYLIKFPCRNALTGCKQQMFVGQKEVHEQECCYRHYQCFFTNCAWKGYYPELHSHMINNHNNCILTGSEQSLDIMLPNNNQTYKWFLLANCEYFAVIAHASIPSRRVKLQVNFIGPAVKAKQFKFSVLLTQHKDRSDMSQKLTYERSTLPYSEIYEMSNNNGLKKDIFSLPGEVLEPFIRKRRRRLPIILKVGPTSGL